MARKRNGGVTSNLSMVQLLLFAASGALASEHFGKQKYRLSGGTHATVEGVKADLTVNVSMPRAALGSLLFGIFFEEINHAGDGGCISMTLSIPVTVISVIARYTILANVLTDPASIAV